MGLKLMLSLRAICWMKYSRKAYYLFLQLLILIVFCLSSKQIYSQDLTDKKITLQAVRSHGNSSVARFVVELNSFTNYKIFTLNNPHRLVLDLTNTSTSKKFDLDKQKLISQLRYSTKKKFFRIVLDISSAFTVAGYGSLKGLKDNKSIRVYIDIKKTTTFKPQSYISNKLETKVLYNVASKTSTKTKNPKASPSISVKKNYKVVVIDAGHGGKDPGAVAKFKSHDIYEKDIVLKFSKILFKQINNMKNFKAILTRSDDSFIPLRDRYAIAEKNDADLFLSIHADSLIDKSVNGISIYTLSTEATDKEASELAKQNNRSDILNDYSLNHLSVDVSGILINLAQETTNRKSWLLANDLVSILKRKYKTINKPLRQADFAVLKSPNIPSILLEIGFLSNSEDVKIMRSLNYNLQVSKLIAEGIKKFFEN